MTQALVHTIAFSQLHLKQVIDEISSYGKKGEMTFNLYCSVLLISPLIAHFLQFYNFNSQVLVLSFQSCFNNV